MDGAFSVFVVDHVGGLAGGNGLGSQCASGQVENGADDGALQEGDLHVVLIRYLDPAAGAPDPCHHILAGGKHLEGQRDCQKKCNDITEAFLYLFHGFSSWKAVMAGGECGAGADALFHGIIVQCEARDCKKNTET